MKRGFESTEDRVHRIATRLVQAMAYSRSQYQKMIWEKLHGAIGEYYKAIIAEKNGISDTTYHWHTEVNDLLRQFGEKAAYNIVNFKDRRGAFESAMKEVKDDDRSDRNTAYNKVVEENGGKKLRFKIDDNDTEAFWRRVEDVWSVSMVALDQKKNRRHLNILAISIDFLLYMDESRYRELITPLYRGSESFKFVAYYEERDEFKLGTNGNIGTFGGYVAKMIYGAKIFRVSDLPDTLDEFRVLLTLTS